MPSYKELLTSELEHEIALTEKFILRIPADKMEWRVHEKSYTLRTLSNHLSDVVGWISATLDLDELEMSTYKQPDFGSVDDIVANLKRNGEAALQSIANAPDSEYDRTWSMKMQGETILEMPKYQCLRTLVLPQLPHHRAQLGVYLRILGEAVPASYGPSADER